MDDTFILYRILGNDLPPRHGPQQTIHNLRFLLDHEPPLPGCQKRWVLNRIVDAEREAELIALLNEHKQAFFRIPFVLDEYARCFLDADGLPSRFNSIEIATGVLPRHEGLLAHDWVYRWKTLYVMNLNRARNMAIADGVRVGATWVMPWDGSCFLTAAAFEQIRAVAAARRDARHLLVPMMRLTDNNAVLDPALLPNADQEPQVIFHREARDRFDETLRYGNMNKVEFLQRIGAPGPWQQWHLTPWEHRRLPKAADEGRHVTVGWVARLVPESEQAEATEIMRWRSRFVSVGRICATLDTRVVTQAAAELTCYSPLLRDGAIRAAAARTIRMAADACLAAASPTASEKTAWPDGATRNGYVGVARFARQRVNGAWVGQDGATNPAASPDAPDAGHYDRHRLQRLVDAVTILALATELTGVAAYAARAAALVRRWFIDGPTRMSPDMRFAQVHPVGPADNNDRGVVDFRDFWPLCDALRLLARAGALAGADQASLREWFRAFLIALAQRGGQLDGASNVGVWHDVVLASAAAYCGEAAVLSATLSRAALRIHRQIQPWGAQPSELSRATPLHYSLFGLQALIALAWLGRNSGIDLWKYSGGQHRSIPMAARFVAVNRTLFSDYAGAAAIFDDRIEAALRSIPADAADAEVLGDLPRRRLADPQSLGAEAGLPPFWAVLLASDEARRSHITVTYAAP